ALAFAQANSQPSVESVEKEALAQRRAIVRGFVTFEYKEVIKPRPEIGDGGTVRVWFDGKKMRQDVLRKEGGKNGIPVRVVSCVGCECDDCQLLYQQTPPGEPLVAVQLDKKQQREVPAVQVEPRQVGFVPIPLFATWAYHLEKFVGRPDRENATVSK